MQEDILRLDVAMHDAAPVCVFQCARDLGDDSDCVVNRQLRSGVEQLTQRLSIHGGHDVEKHAIDVARVEQRDDVRMVQFRGEMNLSEKAFGTD